QPGQKRSDPRKHGAGGALRASIAELQPACHNGARRVKLIQRDGESFLFHISKREKGLLLEVLELYPLIPIAHHRVSRTTAAPRAVESQKLLESALADRTRENKRQLLA